MTEIVNLNDRRKTPAQTTGAMSMGSCLASSSDMVKALISSLEAEGTSIFIASVKGWEVRLEKGKSAATTTGEQK